MINANLSQADLTDACLNGAKLSGANLTEAKLRGANLKSASLIEAKLVRTDLTNTNFNRANLSQAIFSSVKLKNTVFYDAKMPNGKVFSHLNLDTVNDGNILSKQIALKLNASDLLQLETSIQEAVAILYWNIPRSENTSLETIKNIVIQQLNKYISLKIALFNSLEQ